MNEPAQISLFDGIGGFRLAAERCGIQTVAIAEVDRSCCAVHRHHAPGIPNLGDVQWITRKSLPRRIDIITGGFPCQDLSVAGNRAGLAGVRSGLWWEFHRLIGEFKPRWVVIENVPGLLSSNKGLDFLDIIQGLVEVGYCAAWRVLDAQYAGLAQRRQRVFIVASLGNGSCAQVLFEPQSLCWNPPPSQEAGKKVAGTLGARTTSGGGFSTDFECDGGLQVATSHAMTTQQAAESGQLIAFGWNSSKPRAVATAINAGGARRSDFESETFIAFTQNQAGDVLTGDVMHCLNQNSNATGRNSPKVAGAMGVRRLTPVECERLQGFPEGWTKFGIDEKGRMISMSDSARYRMLGNAVAVPVVEGILKEIRKLI